MIDNNLYPTNKLRRPASMIVTMLCRIFGEQNPSHLKTKWVPLIH